MRGAGWCCQRQTATPGRHGASCPLGHVDIVVMLHHDDSDHWHRPGPRHSKFESSHWQWAESEPTSLNHRLQPRLDSMCIQLLWPSGYLLSTKLQRLQVCCWTILRTRSNLAGHRPALENADPQPRQANVHPFCTFSVRCRPGCLVGWPWCCRCHVRRKYSQRGQGCVHREGGRRRGHNHV